MSLLRDHRAVKAALAVTMFALVAEPVWAQTKIVPDAQIESNVLRQLATAPELSTQSIQSSTIYGTVTLSGVVQTEELRTKAENLAARADGVKKVVDQLTLGDPSTASGDQQTSAATDQQANTGAPNCQLQSDGTCAPAADNQNQAHPQSNQQQAYNQQAAAQAQQPAYPQQQSGYGQPQNYPQGSYPEQQPQYSQPPAYSQQPGYAGNGTQPGYGQPAPPRRPMYGNGYAPYPDTVAPSGPGSQQAGQIVTIAPGALLQVRINRGIDSNHIAPGTPFEGMVLNDVVSGGAVAIPRGATVQGTVVDAHKAGALKGRGELALALNGLVLGGQVYPIVSVPWDREGRDKTISTVNSALGLGALGAILGGVSGGGAGAAIGAAAGGAVGVAGSAASGGGRVIVPPESILTFHLAQPTTVSTVSQQEMARLAYAAGPIPGVRPVARRYYSPYGPYYGPPPAPYPYR